MDISNWKDVNKVLGEMLDRFGSMNKNDYEVALFNLMLKNHFSDKSDFSISCLLKIPESKVKRLRYEASLKYPASDAANQEEAVKAYLNKCVYHINGSRIQFSIPDKFVRLYLYNKLAELNTFCDSSFNSNIVSITAPDLALLVNALYCNDVDVKAMLDKIEKSIKSHGEKIQKDKSLTKSFVEAVVQDIGGNIAPRFTEFIIDNFEDIKEKVKGLLQERSNRI